MSYRFVDSFRAEPGWNSVPSWACSKAVYKPVWHITLLSVQWINSWWWTDELSETCRVSWQNKFVKLMHLVGFITENFRDMLLRYFLNDFEVVLFAPVIYWYHFVCTSHMRCISFTRLTYCRISSFFMITCLSPFNHLEPEFYI